MHVIIVFYMKRHLTDKQAIQYIQNQINGIKKISDQHMGSTDHVEWVLTTQNILSDIFGQNSVIYKQFINVNWTSGGRSFVTDYFNYEQKMAQIRQESYISRLEQVHGILKAAINKIHRDGIKNVFEPPLDSKSSNIVRILSIIENQLRKTIHSMPAGEKEIQNNVENLFLGAGLDQEFSREKYGIEYSSKTYIPDFIFNKLDTVLEIKFCKTERRLKEIISEINDDIAAYKTKYTNLIFVIYDIGVIRDQDEFRNSLEANENVIVRIIKQ